MTIHRRVGEQVLLLILHWCRYLWRVLFSWLFRAFMFHVSGSDSMLRILYGLCDHIFHNSYGVLGLISFFFNLKSCSAAAKLYQVGSSLYCFYPPRPPASPAIFFTGFLAATTAYLHEFTFFSSHAECTGSARSFLPECKEWHRRRSSRSISFRWTSNSFFSENPVRVN